MLQDINKEYLSANLKNKQGVYLLVFHALWCPPCRAFKESLEQLNQKDKIEVYRVNIDEEKELAAQFQVQSIPTWFIFKNGTLIERNNGFLPYEQLKKIVEKHL